MPEKFPSLHVLEASAGAGKTRALSQRFVELTLKMQKGRINPQGYRNILAITFTNEAANQMRGRILQLLKEEALKNKDVECVIDDILRNYSQFQVKTIDSFMHSILMSSALQLGLPPYREVIQEDSTSFLEYTLDSLIRKSQGDPSLKKIFLDFVKSYLEVEGKRNWYPKKDLLKFIKELHSREFQSLKSFDVSTPLQNFFLLEAEVKKSLKKFMQSVEERPFKIDKRFKIDPKIVEFSGRSFFKRLFEYIDKDPDRFLKDSPTSLRKIWFNIRDLAFKASLYYAYHSFSPYIGIFKLFEGHLEELKYRKRIVFLEELGKKAFQYLYSAQFYIPEVYYKLASIFWHYLIDEFQDTNRLQWQNLRVLVEEALSGGGSLFYVGDKKQAIYRFRGGDVKLFDEIRDDFKNRVNTFVHKVLKENYRSSPVIVEFNNHIFSPHNLERFLSCCFPHLSGEEINFVKNVFSSSRQVSKREDKHQGYVRLEMVDSKDDELKDKVVSLIKDLTKNVSWEDIMVLVRTHKEEEAVCSWFIEEEIPVYSSRTLDIRNHPLVGEIISFLKFLNSPIDNLSFASFLMGKIFSRLTFKEEYFFRLYLEKLSLNSCQSVLYRKFREDFPEFWHNYIEYFFKHVGFLPPYDLVSIMLRKFSVWRNFPQEEGVFMKLLEILQDLESQKKNSLWNFLEYLDKAREESFFVKGSFGNKLRLFTIHKAKGLESRIVVLPFLGLNVEPTRPQEGSKFVYEQEDNLCLLYLPRYICKAPSLKKIYSQAFILSLVDELNTLYVGLTRAKDQIYGFLPSKVGRKKNVLKDLFEFKDRVWEKGSPYFGKGERKVYVSKVFPFLIWEEKDPHVSLKENFYEEILSQELDLETRQGSRRGEFIHFILSCIEYLDDDYVSYLKELVYNCSCRLCWAHPEEILDALLKFMTNESIRKFFKKGLQSYREFEVVDREGKLKRIDRLILEGKKAVILEYKTGEAEPSHQEQVKEYIGIIKEVYPQREVEAYILYIDKGNISSVA